MKNLSRTVKAGYLALGSASGALTGILIAAFLSRHLTQADYATYRQTLLTYTLVAPLLGLGLPAAVFYFIPRSPDRARSIIAEILIALLFMGVIFAAFCLCGGAELLAKRFNNPDLTRHLKWFAFYPILVLPVTLLSPILVTHNKAPMVMRFATTSATVKLLAIVIPVYFVSNGSFVAVQGLLGGATLSLIVASILVGRTIPKSITTLSSHNLKNMISYALPLSIGTVVATFNLNLDKVLVASFFPPKQFAIFVNGAMEVPLIGVITGSAAAILLPEISDLYKRERYQSAIELFRRSVLKCAKLLIPIGAVLFIMAPEIMVALYGEGFRESASFFRVYLFIIPVRAMVYSVLFQAAGRTDLVLKRALLNIAINSTLSVIFLKLYGPIGAVIGTVISTLIFVVPYCLVSCSKLYHVRPKDIAPFLEIFKITIPILGLVSTCFILTEFQRESKSEIVILMYKILTIILVGAFAFWKDFMKKLRD